MQEKLVLTRSIQEWENKFLCFSWLLGNGHLYEKSLHANVFSNTERTHSSSKCAVDYDCFIMDWFLTDLSKFVSCLQMVLPSMPPSVDKNHRYL